MKILCVFGKYNYGDAKRGASYEYTNFIPALRNLGHEVLFFDSWDKANYQSFSELNKALLELIDSEKPELIFFVMMNYEIWIETLKNIYYNTHAALIHWATDDSWKYEQFSRFISNCFDIFATTYPSAIEKSLNDGFNNYMLTQWASSTVSMAEPLNASDCEYDVVFIGSNYGNRKQWINALRKCGIDVVCFGYGWLNGPVDADDIPNIIRKSKICLNFADSSLMFRGLVPYRSRQIKARIFEVPGSGGFLITEHSENIEKYYCVDYEIVVFDSLKSLVEKIKFYLKNNKKRDFIAINGFLRTKNEHRYEQRFAELIDKALISRNSRQRYNDGIDFDSFLNAESAHMLNIYLIIIRMIFVWLCSLIWGNKRGNRAARRIFFELSWRLSGAKTYSASGWPGRMFFKDS